MKQVYSAGSPIEASLARDFLEGRGIKATVRGEALWGARGELPLTADTLPSVWVDDADFDSAKRQLSDWEAEQKTSTPSRSGWKCGFCGESNEGQFTNCWKCSSSVSDGKPEATTSEGRTNIDVAHTLSTADETQSKRAPLTILILLLGTVMFAQVYNSRKALSWYQLESLGFLPAEHIWSGKFWGLVSSSLIHVDLMTFAFCLGWVWFFGRRIELSYGPVALLIVGLAAAILGQGSILLIHDTTYPGMLSVASALFGFSWTTGDILRGKNEKTVALIPAVFVVSLVFVLIGSRLSWTYKLNVSAPVGFATGMALARVMVTRTQIIPAAAWIALTIVGTVMSVSWMPWSPNWLAHKSYVLLNNGEAPKALEMANSALIQDPGNVMAQFAQGNVYLHNHEISPAIKAFREVIALNPEYAGGYIGLGQALYLAHDYPKSIEALTKAIDLDRDNPSSYVARGWAHLALSSLTDAEADFNQGIKLKADDAGALLGLGAVKSEAGKKESASKILRQSIELLTDAIKSDPNAYDLYEARALAYFILKDYGNAVSDGIKAKELGFGAPLTASNLGWSYLENGSLEDATKNFNDAVGRDDRNEFAHLGLGVVALKRGNTNEALPHIERALEVNPRYAEALTQRGIAWLKKNELSKAKDDFDKVLALNSQSAEALFYRGMVKARSGDSAGADADKKQAISIDSSLENRTFSEP